MKLRRRLSPEEAKSLGLKVKEAESYDSPCKNPRYQVSKEQWNKVATSRKKAKEKAEKSKSLKILGSYSPLNTKYADSAASAVAYSEP